MQRSLLRNCRFLLKFYIELCKFSHLFYETNKVIYSERKKNLFGLYAITHDGLSTDILYKKTEEILANGASILQYRDKSNDRSKRLEEALWLKQCCDEYHCLLMINDDIELADEVSADGVHLGQNDASIADARTALGHNAIIGLSCYNQLALAQEAQEQGASYVAFGAFFPSPTKPNAPTADVELLQQAKSQLDIPICCIGGITTNRAQPLIDANTDMLAVISDLYSAEHPAQVARQYREMFQAARK